MKKTNFFKCILCCSLLGGVGFISTAFMPKNEQVVKAEESEIRDMSKAAMEAAGKTYTRWEAKNGDFVSVDDWLYSNKGFSFEFQFQNPDAKKQAVVAFRSHGTNVACGTSSDYLIRISGTTLSSDFGDLTIVDAGEGWYKFEVMFAEIGDRLLPNNGATGHETLDEMFFTWGESYCNDLNVKNMKVIDFVERTVASTTKQIWSNKNSNNANQDRRFMSYKNWYNSGKGFFLEFKYGTGNNLHGQLMGSSTDNPKTYNKAAISSVRYLVNNKAAQNGRLHEVGDGWYRYEAMFNTFTPTADTDVAKGATVQGFNFQWGNGYNPGAVRSFGVIDGLCNKVTFHVGLSSTIDFRYEKAVKPANPVESGKHFVGWYSDEGLTQAYDFETALSADLNLYAKFENHDFVNPTYVWAEDGSLVTGTATCACGEKYVVETVPSYTKDTDATCLNNEKGHMTATFTDAPFETQTTAKDSVIVPMSKLDHDLDHHDAKSPSCLEAGNKEYWQCKSCQHVFKDSAAAEETTMEERTIGAKGHTLVLVNGQAPDCTTDGWKDYYECSDDHALFEDAEGTKAIADLDAWKVGDGKLGATGHTLNKVDGKVPSCTEDGWKDYYQCSKCQALFEDEQGQTPITDLEAWKVGDGKLGKVAHDLQLVNGKPETCTEDGWKNYYQCKECKACFEDAAGAKPIADLAAWKVGDGKIAAHGHDDNNVTKVDGKEPGCEEPGYKDAYFCMECGKYFEDVNATKLIGAKDSDLDAWRLGAGKLDPKGHTYKFVEEVAATKDKDGVKAHYVCEYCGKLFVKEGEVYKEVTLNDLVIKYQAKGCGGSIIASSAILGFIAIAGLALVASKKKED